LKKVADADLMYSRAVAWLKILLPMAALVLLSTIFLLARNNGGDGSIPFAEIESMAREQRISGPQFSGVADDGSIIEISAESARPLSDGANGLSLEGLRASLRSLDGVQIEFSAGMGRIDNTARTAELSSLTRIVSSNGYQMETAGLTADLETGSLLSHGPLEVRTPFGMLEAGELLIETSQTGNGRRMIFQSGVKLIYTPQQ